MAVFALKRNPGGLDTARCSCGWRSLTLFHAFYPCYRVISGDLDSRFFTRDCSCLHCEWLSRQVNTVLNSYYRWLPHPISYSCFVDSHFPAFSLHGSDPCRFVRTQSPFVYFFSCCFASAPQNCILSTYFAVIPQNLTSFLCKSISEQKRLPRTLYGSGL